MEQCLKEEAGEYEQQAWSDRMMGVTDKKQEGGRWRERLTRCHQMMMSTLVVHELFN